MKLRFEENILKVTEEGVLAGEIRQQVILQLWNGKQENATVEKVFPYTDVHVGSTGNIIAKAAVKDTEAGELEVCDTYKGNEEGIEISRKLKVLKAGNRKGIRLNFKMGMFPEAENRFAELRFFAPPAIFDKNDLDEDGYEDYFHTRKVIYRDDRFNYPHFMAYSEEKKVSIRLERNPLPAYDSVPERIVNEATREKAALFLQKTDIGSMGADGSGGGQTQLMASYPFYEGNATIGLYIMKMVPFGAFWPLETGESFSVTYQLSATKHDDFHHACWYNVKHVIQTKKPKASELIVSADKLTEWRLKSLDQYYVEKSKEEDEHMPAGYVLNCHPQEGKQLKNIIQYGFTGQNILNALNVLRYGYENGIEEYCQKAVKTADFFVNVLHMPETGMFFNLYNVDMKQVDFWWTGILLPLAYAQGEELERLMGPLYEYRKPVIQRLSKLKGAYLRCMNEDAAALLRLYRYERNKGNNHEKWRNAIENYAKFLLRTQEPDGGWYRAYDIEGNPVTEPEIWFGKSIYEKKSSTGTSITFLTEMYQLTGEGRYLEAAVLAGEFVKAYMIDRVRFNGGVHDSIYAKGQLIDNEGILYPMLGMLSLYEVTKRDDFLEGAVRAARMNASWVCLWKVPLPIESTLARNHFNSIGMGACDSCGAGYVHPFQLMCVAELAQIAIYAKDQELLEAAKLYWTGCNQTVAVPGKDWGYAAFGLQEEGYLISWWAVDDPMFGSDTGFGYRLKGEGNKTCFPWINAVGVKGYYSLTDRFGTTNFDEIARKYMEMEG